MKLTEKKLAKKVLFPLLYKKSTKGMYYKRFSIVNELLAEIIIKDEWLILTISKSNNIKVQSRYDFGINDYIPKKYVEQAMYELKGCLIYFENKLLSEILKSIKSNKKCTYRNDEKVIGFCNWDLDFINKLVD